MGDLREISEYLPDRSKKLTQYFDDNPEEFQRLIIDTQLLILGVATRYPDVIQHILDYPIEFTRLITNINDLQEIANAFPNHAKEFIQHVLDDPDEFKRIVKNDSEIQKLADEYKKHIKTNKENIYTFILAQETIDNAVEAIWVIRSEKSKSKKDVESAAKLLSTFSKVFGPELPPEMIEEAAIRARNPAVHSEYNAKKIVRNRSH